MTSIESLFRATVAAVDGACPCRHADGILLDVHDPHMCEKVCQCSVSLGTVPACRQIIHATIRERLGKIAERMHGEPCDCIEPRDIIIGPGCAALRERIKEVLK